MPDNVKYIIRQLRLAAANVRASGDEVHARWILARAKRLEERYSNVSR